MERVEITDDRHWTEYPKDAPEPLSFQLENDSRPSSMEFSYTMGNAIHGHWKGEITPTSNGVRLKTTDGYTTNSWLMKMLMGAFFDLDGFAKDWNNKLKPRVETVGSSREMLVRTIALVVLAMLSGLTAPAQQSTRQTSALSFGNPRADYRIEVFYDLQCGSCVSFHEGLKKVEDRFPNKVYITIRHFPLPLHDQAFMASTVVEAASRQGKGLEMVEALLNDQGRWSTAKKPFSVVFEYVKQLGLDEKKFRADLQTDGVALSVLLDLHRGKGLGVNSTPTTFLNGKQLSFIEALELEEIISKGSN